MTRPERCEPPATAARFDFALEEKTAALLAQADLSSVSEDRRRAELLRLASETEALRGIELAVQWKLIEPRPGGMSSPKRSRA